MYIPRWIKYLYQRLPLRRSLLITMRNLYVPEYRLSQRLNFDGPFRVKVGETSFLLQNYDDYDHVIENQIFWQGLTGRWEKKSLRIWMDLCNNAHTICDIGANTGVYALAAQAVNPNANVFAFEPVERIYAELELNVRLNAYPIRCIPHALSNIDGIQTLYERPGTHDYTASLNRHFMADHFAGVDYQSKELTTVRLATLIVREHVQAIDLMKIDVETHEYEVLLGMGEFLEKMKPTLLLEILNDNVGQLLEPLMRANKYLMFAIDENEGPRRVDTLRVTAPLNYLMCNETIAREMGLLLNAK